MAGETTDTTMLGRMTERLNKIEGALHEAFTRHTCVAAPHAPCPWCTLYEFLNRR